MNKNMVRGYFLATEGLNSQRKQQWPKTIRISGFKLLVATSTIQEKFMFVSVKTSTTIQRRSLETDCVKT